MAFSAPLSAASATSVDSTGGDIFDEDTNGGPKSAIWIQVDPASSFPALINVPGLHKASEFTPIAIGQSQVFALGTSELKTAFAKGSGGTATMSWGIVGGR